MITEKEQILVLAAGFFLSRTLSGIGVVSLRCAKTNGMLYQFASEAHRRVVLTALYLQLVLCVGLVLAVSVKTGALACAAAGLTTRTTDRRVTGNLAVLPETSRGIL